MPRIAAVGRFSVAVASGGVDAVRRVGVGPQRVVVPPAALRMVPPGLAAVVGPDDRAGLDGDVEPVRVVRVDRNPPDVVGVRPRRERPALGGGRSASPGRSAQESPPSVER